MLFIYCQDKTQRTGDTVNVVVLVVAKELDVQGKDSSTVVGGKRKNKVSNGDTNKYGRVFMNRQEDTCIKRVREELVESFQFLAQRSCKASPTLQCHPDS